MRIKPNIEYPDLYLDRWDIYLNPIRVCVTCKYYERSRCLNQNLKDWIDVECYTCGDHEFNNNSR